MPTPQYIGELLKLLLVEERPGEKKSRTSQKQKLISRVRDIWPALTLFHETKLDRNLRIAGFHALLLQRWYIEDRASFSSTVATLDCADQVRKLVHVMHGPKLETWNAAVLIKLYVWVCDLLVSEIKDNYDKKVVRVQKAADFVRQEFGDINIVLIADAIVAYILTCVSVKGRDWLPVSEGTYSPPGLDFLAEAFNLILCQPPDIEENQYRRWDGETPSGIHPIWCALTHLLEKNLPWNEAVVGFYVLLFHDWIEDVNRVIIRPGEIFSTTDPFYEITERIDCRRQVRLGVGQMTFEGGFPEEYLTLWSRDVNTILRKQYDKVSNLLDWGGTRASKQKKLLQLTHLEKINAHVSRELAHFGPLCINHIALNLITKLNEELFPKGCKV